MPSSAEPNIRMSDLYGTSLPGTGSQTLTPSTQQASGSPGSTDKTPAMFWMALVFLLFVTRWLWEMSPQSKD